jgi:hypothetical protein
MKEVIKPKVIDEINNFNDKGMPLSQINRIRLARTIIHDNNLKISVGRARNIISEVIRDYEQYKTTSISTDKVVGEFNWRNAITHIQGLKQMYQDASYSQDRAKVSIDTDKPICIVTLGDLHMGSAGTDYDLLLKMTDEIKNTPNLYVILVGDLLQMAIKLRNVLEVSDNILPPKFQIEFLDSWLSEIKHKVIASTWDNHSVMREEQAVGFSTYSSIFNRHTIYHNGIGHLDIKVGEQVYKLAVAHFFRGRSVFNPVHGQVVYMQREGVDREIAIAGDSHVPGISKFVNGDMTRVAVNCGSLQTNSGYGKRFFSLTTHPVFPCFTLDPKEHLITPYWSIQEWLNK